MKVWPIDPLVPRNLRLEVPEKLPQGLPVSPRRCHQRLPSRPAADGQSRAGGPARHTVGRLATQLDAGTPCEAPGTKRGKTQETRVDRLWWPRVTIPGIEAIRSTTVLPARWAKERCSTLGKLWVRGGRGFPSIAGLRYGLRPAERRSPPTGIGAQKRAAPMFSRGWYCGTGLWQPSVHSDVAF